MTFCLFAALLVLPALGTSVAVAASGNAPIAQGGSAVVSAPVFDRIRYDRPTDYLALTDAFGNCAAIEALAKTLKQDTPEHTLVTISRWMSTNLIEENKAAYAYRNFDAVTATHIYGGCADYAIVYAGLARACGIPAVFVKTMDVEWIRHFRTSGGDPGAAWSGHVFLEVYFGDRWHLLEDQGMQLWDDYDPHTHLLPDNRWAYDKGGDPRSLILSLDWERWKQQTAAYFSTFDLAQLPMGVGRRLQGSIDAFVAANSPLWQQLVPRLQGQGHRTYSFNTAFEKFLPEAVGHDLIVTCVGGTPVLPAAYWHDFLPLSAKELKRETETHDSGVVRKRMPNGTNVVLLYGKDVSALQKAIATFEF